MSERIPEQATPVEVINEADRFEYRLLKGHPRTDGSWKTDRQLRMEYLQLTDGLIHKMTDGVDVVDPITEERRKEVPDVVVWLDKSARPVSWLTRDLWSKMAADPVTGKVPPMPSFKFVNIDRQQWVNSLDPEGAGIMDIDRVDQSIIRSLRSVFVEPKFKTHGLTQAIDAAPSELDNKTVMIVDEVYSSGRTLQYASAFFRRAFPTARIGSAYWMHGVTMKKGSKGNADLPVWYKEKDVRGRGVDTRNDSLSGKSKNTTQRLGRFFLSTRLREPDPKSRQLREELHQLATNPDVPVMPSVQRADREDRRTRMSAYNGGMAVEEVIAAKNAIKAER